MQCCGGTFTLVLRSQSSANHSTPWHERNSLLGPLVLERYPPSPVVLLRVNQHNHNQSWAGKAASSPHVTTPLCFWREVGLGSPPVAEIKLSSSENFLPQKQTVGSGSFLLSTQSILLMLLRSYLFSRSFSALSPPSRARARTRVTGVKRVNCRPLTRHSSSRATLRRGARSKPSCPTRSQQRAPKA